jgi:hypothetical protein
MVRHIVFFKLDQEHLDKKDIVVTKLKSLKDKIDFIEFLEVGINFTDSPRAYDISLIVDVQTKEDLSKYAKHSEHIPVVEYLKSINTTTKVVDYIYS